MVSEKGEVGGNENGPSCIMGLRDHSYLKQSAMTKCHPEMERAG